HALAAVVSLAISDETVREPVDDDAEPEIEGLATLSDDGRDAARLAWRASAELLAGGATAARAVAQAEGLRAVHACRALGLHRAAAAGLRVVQSVRDLRAERPEFALSTLAEHVHDLLETARSLAERETAGAELVGVARRTYTDVGNLRLRGLF